LPFSFIGKLEHFEEDVRTVLGEEIGGRNLPRLNRAKEEEENARDLFSKLSCCLIRGLFRLYEDDFRMFDYEADQYLDA